jgi:hypothetical protein
MKNLLLTAAAFFGFAAASMGQTLPAYLPSDGLVGWWPFNGNANDESGNGNNGTVNGATLNEDRFGNSEKAYDFIQTNDFLTLPGVVTNSISNAMSVSLWAKHQTLDATGYIFDKAALPGNYDRATLLHWGTDLRVYNENSFYSSYSNVLDTNWHHYLIILNGNEVILFIDGVSSGIGILGNNFLNTPGIITLGKANNTNLDNYNGNIDDIAIYNRALSQEEITALYTGEPVNPPTTCNPLPANLQNGLVGYWPFCGNANDESGNGNDGAVNGATLTEDRFGVANAAYDFDGVDQYINIGDAGLNSNPDTFTISTWTFVDSLYVGYYGATSVILSKRHIDNGPSWTSLQIDSLGAASFSIDGPGYLNEVNGTASMISSWNNIVGIKAGSKYSLYVNGTLVSEEVDNYQHSGSTMDMHVGNHGAWNTFFYGKIDDIGIWNRALTAEEVQELYTLNACTFSIYDTTYVTIYDTVSVSTTDTLIINTLITAVQPAQENTFLVYPNPAGSQITINNGNVGILGGYTMRISNSIGQDVYNQNITQTEVTLDLSNWGGNGLYVLYILDPQGEIIAVKQIVLQ